MARAAAPGMIASVGLTSATAPAPDQVIDENASANVAMRDETWRRRNKLRFTCLRNQNWIRVADPAAIAMPMTTTRANIGSTSASRRAIGANTRPITPATASALDRQTRAVV